MLALFFANLDWDKETFRANIAAYALICTALVLVMIYPTGLMTRDVLGTSVSLLPALALGWLLGVRVLRFIDQRQFARLIILLIALSGVVLVAISVVQLPPATPAMSGSGLAR